MFNADSLWQILFKRDKKVKLTLEEREKIKVYGWKQLYKDRQMQTSIKGRKVLSLLKFQDEKRKGGTQRAAATHSGVTFFFNKHNKKNNFSFKYFHRTFEFSHQLTMQAMQKLTKHH